MLLTEGVKGAVNRLSVPKYSPRGLWVAGLAVLRRAAGPVSTLGGCSSAACRARVPARACPQRPLGARWGALKRTAKVSDF